MTYKTGAGAVGFGPSTAICSITSHLKNSKFGGTLWRLPIAQQRKSLWQRPLSLALSPQPFMPRLSGIPITSAAFHKGRLLCGPAHCNGIYHLLRARNICKQSLVDAGHRSHHEATCKTTRSQTCPTCRPKGAAACTFERVSQHLIRRTSPCTIWPWKA